MSRRRSKQENSGGGAPGWMTTFSDLMSLLLTFFILLYSMSTIDVEKFKNITYSLQSILAGIGQPSPIEGGQPDNNQVPIEDYLDNEDMDEGNIPENILIMYEKVSDYVSDKGLDAKITVTANRRGVFVDIKEAILFEPGKAELKESGVQVLKELEGLINDFDNEMVIEGHTDDVPMNSLFYPSNWELSTARAVTVVRYLSETENVDPKRLSAVGYGEFRPIAPNDSAINRATNRRVNILIIINEEGVDVNGDS